MIGPKNNDLKSISEFNSTWADRLAYLILAGLLVDIADLFIPEGWWKIVAAIGANLLIFGGVWGELWFAKRARDADDSRVAEANVRAADAQLEADPGCVAKTYPGYWQALHSLGIGLQDDSVGRNIDEMRAARLPAQ